MALQPYAPMPDLRQIRTKFLPKGLAYALSYDYKLNRASLYAPDHDTVSIRFFSKTGKQPGRDRSYEPGGDRVSECGDVFTVLGDTRVPGLDGLGHEAPAGFHVGAVDECVTLRWTQQDDARGLRETVAGLIEGRMVFEAPKASWDGSVVRISVTYEGMIRSASGITREDVHDARVLEASAHVTAFFETSLPEYHWLTENASIAFGTWSLTSSGQVEGSFDVYCAS